MRLFAASRRAPDTEQNPLRFGYGQNDGNRAFYMGFWDRGVHMDYWGQDEFQSDCRDSCRSTSSQREHDDFRDCDRNCDCDNDGLILCNLNDNRWHHVAFVYDGRGGTKGYVDGELRRQGRCDSLNTVADSGRGQFRFGANPSEDRWRGELDEVAILDIAVEAEVK